MANLDIAVIDDDIVDLPIEDMGDGTVAIGETLPADIKTEPGLGPWDDNLISEFSDDELQELAIQCYDDYEQDVESRKDWLEIYEKGLKSLKPETQVEESRKRRNLSMVIHPVIAEAATQFQARAIGEMFPPSGPVGVTIIGQSHEAVEKQAKRVHDFMNYQLMEEMEEYFPDMDQMLFHLPLTGHTFKKSWCDVNLQRITSQFCTADDLVIDANATTLATASRYTQVLRLPPQTYHEYVANGFYEKVDLAEQSDPSDTQTVAQEVEGVEPSLTDEEGLVILLEQHLYHPHESDEDEPDKPFIVTLHKETKQIVSIRRNWDEDDERCKKNVWFVSYKFLPGLGFYGFGLYHIIGGLGKAATGALRSLLDAATYANMQGGLKLRGRIKSGEIEIAPGEFADIDAAVDDIKKAVMPLPFKEPSQTMFALLQYIVDVAKSFANSAEVNISDANQNTPVGTTVALLEENARVFSAIHKRLHYSQRSEFKLIAKLNGMYLPDEYPYRVKDGEQTVLRSDFDDRVDVVPVSDPATFSSTQRISQAQAGLQMATAYPQFHDIPAALRRMYEALRIPNYEEVLIDPTDVDRMDAVTENVAIMNNRPVKTYEDQDHIAHMTVLDDWFKKLPPQGQQMFMPAFTSHRAEHMSLLYRTMIQAQLGAALPPLPDFKDPNAPNPEIDPILDTKISQAAAQAVNANPQQPMGPPVPQPQQPQGGAPQDPAQAAAQLAQIEAQTTMAKAQADIQAKQMKAQADIQIQQMKVQADMQVRQMELQMEMQIEQVRERTKIQAEQMREAAKSSADREKAEQEIEIMWAKAEAEITIAREKAQANIKAKLMETASKARIAAADAAKKNTEASDGGS
jgi:hypothetical protein